jgi:adenylyltransferase/sulfurtransferase
MSSASDASFTPEDRYRRHLQLAEVGEAGQARLRGSCALVVGAGGLGCAALPYLVAAGLRQVIICDGDRIEPSNLPRQVLYGDGDVGRAKADVAAERLAALNRDCAVTPVAMSLTAANADALVGRAAIVLDATDDFASRYLLHDACRRNKRPLVTAAVHHDDGQLAVLRFDRPDPGPCWRCLWPAPPAAAACGSGCRDQGILGPVPGVLGVMQADQALRVLLEASPLEPGTLVHVDLPTLSTWRSTWEISPTCPLCGMGEAVPGAGPAPGGGAEEARWEDLHAPEAFLWIDARTDADQAADPRPSALGELFTCSWRQFGAAGPPPGRHCLVFCGHGVRSLELVRHWRGAGCAHVTSLSGGLAAQRMRRT